MNALTFAHARQGLFASALRFLTRNSVVEILEAIKSSVYIYMVG